MMAGFNIYDIARGRSEKDAIRLQRDRDLQSAEVTNATDLASRINAFSATNQITAHSSTDGAVVNVFKALQALVITPHDHGEYSLELQTQAGAKVMGGGVPLDKMSADKMMHAAMQWLRR
jgi:hypothetical protein